jgi:outer membrane protein OmpA-like peptidoglycan-associated protein
MECVMTSRILQMLFMLMSMAILLAACTSASGPTYNLYSEKSSDGTKVYRVECGGLLESSATCRSIAERTCGNQPVSVVQERDRMRPDAEKANPRMLVFRCGAAPTVAVAPSEAPAAKELENFTLNADALFAFGKADLASMLPAGKAQLTDVIERIRTHKDATSILVVGHTDRIGSDAVNKPLSIARANTVRDFMISRGLNGSMIQAEGVGSTQPVSHCPEGRSRAVIACLQPDRRVQITVNGQR